jgi:hypothetical protein
MPCTVVFLGAGGDRQTSLVLSSDAGDVAAALAENLAGFVAFEDPKGRTVWINPANVLYVEPRNPKSREGDNSG